MSTLTDTIILMGPSAAGKSVLASMLAKYLRRPMIDFDALHPNYYMQFGFDFEEARSYYQQGGLAAWWAYWEPFHVAAIRRVLPCHQGNIIALTAAHSVFTDSNLLATVQQILAPYPDVFLLLPSPDRIDSYRILRDRLNTYQRAPERDQMIASNRYFLRQPGYIELTKHIVYTQYHTPQDTMDAILRRLRPW